MSFLRLFAAGKGLIGMSDGQTPYRMRREIQLPKFHSTKNPFVAHAKNDAEQVEPGKSQPIRAESAAALASAHTEASANIEATPAPAPVIVAPMETFPLFDAELNPAVQVNVPAPVRGSVRVVTITQSKLPVTQARQGWSDLIATAPLKMDMDMGDTAILGKKKAPAKPPGPLVPAPVGGLADTSPLGLKSGTPTKPVLPEPVTPRKNKKPAAEKPADAANNCVEETENIEVLPHGQETSNIEHRIELNAAMEEQARGDARPTGEPMGAVSASGAKWSIGSVFAVVKKVNPVGFLRSLKRERKAARPAVQTELSLDRVKVMRNDLSEADLEVVTAPTQKASAPAATPAPAPRLEPISAMEEATTLSRLTARFFGAGETVAAK